MNECLKRKYLDYILELIEVCNNTEKCEMCPCKELCEISCHKRTPLEVLSYFQEGII